MALPSFLKRKSAPPSPRAKPVAAFAAGDASGHEAARVRARRRLIGATVLLAAGVILFPLLFENRPRPIPMDLPLEVARAPGTAPAATGRSGTVKPVKSLPAVEEAASAAGGGSPPPAPVDSVQAPVTPPVSSPAAAPVAVAAAPVPAAPVPAVTLPLPTAVQPAASKPAPAPAPVPAPALKPAPASSAASAQAPAPLSASAAEGKTGRFVVQVGAFADAGTAREARGAVEKLGLKTYTQVVETAAGKRIRVRVGPFPTREEAVKALATLKAAQLPGAVLTL